MTLTTVATTTTTSSSKIGSTWYAAIPIRGENDPFELTICETQTTCIVVVWNFCHHIARWWKTVVDYQSDRLVGDDDERHVDYY